MNEQESARIQRLENRINVLTHHLIQAFQTIEHLSLNVPDQTVQLYNRALCKSVVESLRSMNRPRRKVS